MTAEPKEETLSIRLPAGTKARLEALAARRKGAARSRGSDVTMTSLVRGAVLRALDDADRREAGR